ncbi:glycosyltransferase family 39 protein [Actinomadura sp. HBU206391]|uniref:glycosyltransferase family 39 protein n=1 Tax=Actinomadura sp. HBU206391 TaxID=2731692 RepID=UPI002905C136|nr:glycosyltransferase family 39 protein [Actinomadura sp. HBU206391]
MAGATSDGTALDEAALERPVKESEITPSVTAESAGPGSPSEPAEADPERRIRGIGFWALVGRHRPFTALLVVGALLRVVTLFGYRPAMWFNDSYDYLHAAMRPYPHPIRPNGYSFLLMILRPFHSFALVVTVQHVMGVAMAVMIYALLRRRFGLPGWGAALATAPVLLDAYQIQLEHVILSDVPFTFLVVSAITLLLWRAQPSWQVGAAVGLILGLATLTRSVGLPVLVAVAAFMVVRRMRWRVIAAMLVVCALPMVAYMGWFQEVHGKFAMTESNGIFLYARVYKFADCDKIKPPVHEIPLCVEPQHRLPFSQDGIWNRESPLLRNEPERFTPMQNNLTSDFSKRAILAQPVDYLRVMAGDFFRVFKWERTVFPDWATYEQYEFRKTPPPLPDWRMSRGATAAQEAAQYEQGRARPKVVEPFAGVMRGYQDHVYLRGSLLGVILLIGLAGLVASWRRFGGAALLPWITAVGLLLAPAATAEFDYRYVLPTVPLACLAAAIAFTSLPRERLSRITWRRWRRRAEEQAPTEAEQKPEPVAV